VHEIGEDLFEYNFVLLRVKIRDPSADLIASAVLGIKFGKLLSLLLRLGGVRENDAEVVCLV